MGCGGRRAGQTGAKVEAGLCMGQMAQLVEGRGPCRAAIRQ